jgi:exopolyphosphatase
MGNEAGDLDTVASSLAFAWIQAETRKIPTIPLIQTERSDIGLRAENVYALSLAGLQHDVPELLCIDDLLWTGAFPSNTFALVDHNRLLPQYSAGNPDVKVVAVVDHHEDEGLYKDSAETRIIAPAGSCASHVAHLCHPPLPSGLASLLLSAILIDTQGLKAGGKALQVDHEAVASLISQATSSSPSSTNPSQLSQGHELKPEEPVDVPFIRDLTAELLEKKNSVSHLSTRDLLRRDYKQYYSNLPWALGATAINSGLSTVPIDLKTWIPRDTREFWSSINEWMELKKLSILGILTSFHDEKSSGKSGRGKHKRQMLWVVHEGVDVVVDQGLKTESSDQPKRLNVDELASRLWAGLEASQDLELEKSKLEKFGTSEQDLDSSMRIRIYKQGNTNASRKTTAPLLKNILESHIPSSAGNQKL